MAYTAQSLHQILSQEELGGAQACFFLCPLKDISFELRCLLSFSVAWKGEQLADMSTALSNPVSCPLVFAHKRFSLLSLSGLYSTNSRTNETPNGPTPLYSPSNRGSSETSTAYPIQYHDLAVFANPCQLLFCETHARNNPGVHVIFDGFPFRQFTSLRKRRRNSYPHVSGGRTLWVMPVFTTYLSALNA